MEDIYIKSDAILYKFWLLEKEIVTQRKTNVHRGEAEVDIGFRGVTISHVTISCIQYLLYYTEC